jgi:hypothetical protein
MRQGLLGGLASVALLGQAAVFGLDFVETVRYLDGSNVEVR